MKLFVAHDYWLGSNLLRTSKGSTKHLDFLGLKAGDLEALETQKLGQKESPKILAAYNLQTWEFETTPVEGALLSCWPNEHCRLGIAAKASTFSTFSPLPNYPLSLDHLPTFTNALTNDRLELRFPLHNYPLSQDNLPTFSNVNDNLELKFPLHNYLLSQARPFPTFFFKTKMTNQNPLSQSNLQSTTTLLYRDISPQCEIICLLFCSRRCDIVTLENIASICNKALLTKR